jgi:hypothetical protein
MAEAVARGRFAEARLLGSGANGALHQARWEMVCAEDAGVAVDVLPTGREDPLPARLPRCPGVLALQGLWKRDRSAAIGYVSGAFATDLAGCSFTRSWKTSGRA